MIYSPVTRLLTLLDLLQSRPGVTAAHLAERLEVEARSVRRYITMLQDIGIPVEAVRGRYGGYRLRPGFKLPPLMWSEEEAVAVTLGLQAMRQLGLSQTIPTVEQALAKVERVLPQSLREQVQAVQKAVRLDLVSRPRSEPNTYVVPLSLAARLKEKGSGCAIRLVQAKKVNASLTAMAWSIITGNGTLWGTATSVRRHAFFSWTVSRRLRYVMIALHLPSTSTASPT